MIGKKLFRFDEVVKGDLNLTLPDKTSYKNLRSQILYQNKEYLWNSIKFIVTSLSDFQHINWTGTPEMQNGAEKVTQILKERKANSLKDIMVDFYCFFYGNNSNLIEMANFLMTEKGMEIAKHIVDKGALCLALIPEMMSWIKYKPSHWNSNMDANTLDRWQGSKDTAPVAMMSNIVNGAAPQIEKRSYYTPIYPYIFPDYTLIQYVISKECPSLIMTDIPDHKSLGLTLFSGHDLFGNETSLQTLIVSGAIPIGKTKIGINTVKKLNSFITLAQFPEGMKCVMSRSEYMANAAILNFGEPSDMEFPNNLLPAATFLRGMYHNIQVTSRYYMTAILANSVRNLSQEFFYFKKTALSNLFRNLADLLIVAHEKREKGWIRYESFCKRCNYMLALSHQDYIYPDKYILRPDSVKTSSGTLMPPSDFKKNIHDVILRAMIEGMAAIGGIDLLIDAEGNISHLRLSEGGKWYVEISDNLPEANVPTNVAESIEVDDVTGLITVRKPDYAYVNMLLEFADKMTETRFCFSEKAFLKKCDTPEVLEAKIKRFLMFFLPKPGPNISHRLQQMQDNCNLVKKTAGGSTFQLFDIDSKNSRLHNLILDNNEIRKNSLRVEGCKLLIKTKFLTRFFEILTENGFLNNEKD